MCNRSQIHHRSQRGLGTAERERHGQERSQACVKLLAAVMGDTARAFPRSFLIKTIIFVLAFEKSTALSTPSSPRGDAFRKTVAKAASLLPPPPGADLISSSLISQLAVLAIKSRLKEERDVTCEVAFSSSDLLLNGLVGPVTVKGKDWSSGRGLTCRAIEATVDQCSLDASKVISNRKLLLTTPALGRAMVALNARDFGNFIKHPLLKPPVTTVDTSVGSNAETNEAASQIEFLSEGTEIDPATSSVSFLARYAGVTWRCILQRSPLGKKAMVTVSLADEDSSVEGSNVEQVATQLGEVMQNFFNEMVFDLDGTYLSFRDMMVTAKGEAPSVMISLNIKVRKLPSPGIDF